MRRQPIFCSQIIWIFGFLLILAGLVHANDKYPGKYRLMKEPEIHTKGKVVLLEFADFYCPHCHMFENEVGAKLKKEFVNITSDVEKLVQKSSIKEGICLVNAMHITCLLYTSDAADE